MRINKHDTNGTKPLLGKGELGYDDYTAGGDTGRVYVGTGAENIAMAKRLESNMMTKAQFNALAEERKANRAGSGFDEWGKQLVGAGAAAINDGLWCYNLDPNQLHLGRATGTGVSKTDYPVVNINGVCQILKYIGTNTTNLNNITLPTAPNIYPYDTVLTAEQIASGVIKHADASNSGLIVNGKFDTDTSGWEVTNGGAISSVSGKLVVNANGNSYGGCKQTFATIIGKQYTVEFEVSSILNSTDFSFLCRTSSNANLTQFVISSPNRYVINFTATTATSYVIIESRNSTNMIVTIDNIAVYPADAISRSDLVFLELTTSNAA